MKKHINKIFFAFIMLFACTTLSQNVLAATDTYTVQPGDTLWIISKKYKVGLSEVIGANPQFRDPNLIYPKQKVYVPLPDPVVKDLEQQVIDLVNAERAKAGLKALKVNWEVARVAQYKSDEMRDKNYFSHTSPAYGSPFDMLKKFNVTYKSAGENIAKGQTTAEAVVRSWMNSEGHKKNIMSSNFTEIGVGYSSGSGTTYWTQLFISK